MQFQKLTISVTLAALALATQQHAANANPSSASQASTKYEFILQQSGLQTAQPKPTQSRLQKNMTGTSSLSSIPQASTKYEFILQQLGLQKTQPQTMLSQSQKTQN